MSLAEQFPEITTKGAPLAPFTHLKIGGPAEFLLQPRTLDELNAVLAACRRDKVPVRMLGGGYNLLIRDDPVPGAVIRLVAEPFTFLKRDGKRVTAFDPGGKDVPADRQWYEPKREPKRPAAGYLGLQTHDPGDVVYFREVSIRPLAKGR